MKAGPLRSHSSVYFERYARAEQANLTLGFTAYLLGGLCFILAIALVVVSTRPRAVHYVPSASAAGISWPQQVPSSSVISFATAWLMNGANYAPETVEGVYERSLAFMSPALSARIRAGLDDELGRIARDRLSSVFTLMAEPQLAQARDGFTVTFEGRRMVYMGKEEMSAGDERCVVVVRRSPPTENNPYGLVVDDVRKERIGHAGT